MTVGEAKARMTYREHLDWMLYFEKRGYSSMSGSMAPQMQQGFALLAATLINVNGGYKDGSKAKITDFIPGTNKDVEGGMEEVAALLSSMSPNKDPGGVRKLWKRARRR